jgi:hypothetical protein
MLYKNDVIFELSRFPKEVKEIEDHFHNKFPVKIVYPPDRIVPSRLKHNRLPDKPASIAIPFKATVKTDNGIETWIYAENVITDEAGKKKYLPTHLMLEEKQFLERNDIEKIFFLLRKSPFCLGGDNEGMKKKFTFEDLVSDAEKKVEKKKIQQRVDALLYGELALPEEKLREIAGAYFIPNNEDKTLSQIQLALGDIIFSTKTGPTKFFDMIDAEDEIKGRASVWKLINNLKLLEFNAVSKSWYWKTTGGKDALICRVSPSVSNNTEALYDYYKGSQDFQDDVQAALVSKKSPKKE